ncbi:unnamed protein product [Linum trigynum]|uniref:LOB domain-containing protein n=1 Tax=Linum trigynum TaxID=586398 RepID=A0AAV2D6L0_9ROSI
MTLKGGTSHACAACKYQRRKCTSECQLAPYFPANKPEMFRNAHKLFGVRNIVKILEKLDGPQRQEAMHSIIWQANIRDLYPVQGCYGYICRLQYQIRQAEEELHAIHAQLNMYRQHHHHHHGLDAGTAAEDMVPSSQLELGMAPPASNNNNAALTLFGHNPAQQPYAAAGVMAQLPSPVTPDQQQQLSYPISSNPVGGYNTGYFDATKDDNNNNNNNVAAVNSFWLQHTYGMNNNNNAVTNSSSSMGALQSQLLAAQPLGGIQEEVVQDYDEMHPFFDTIDDRQSYIDSKEAYDTSSEESLKDTTQSLEQHVVAEDELKSAAACFSLTSVN